jgi:hypothetical protein
MGAKNGRGGNFPDRVDLSVADERGVRFQASTKLACPAGLPMRLAGDTLARRL